MKIENFLQELSILKIEKKYFLFNAIFRHLKKQRLIAKVCIVKRKNVLKALKCLKKRK